MALKDILGNAKYADDMVLALPDGSSATVGEMRALETEEKQRLISRSQMMEKAEEALAERIMEAQRRGILTPATPVDDATIRQQAAAQFGLSEDDPLLGQVAKEFRRIEADNKARETAIENKLLGEINALKGITGKAIQANLNDFYDARFQVAVAALPQPIREKVKLEDAVKYAEEHRLMDKMGRYEIDRAVKQLTWDDAKEVQLAEERKELQKTSEKAAQLANMNRPSPNALRTRHAAVEGFDPMTKDGKVKSFDEALADAANDENMWVSLAQTASGFGPN